MFYDRLYKINRKCTDHILKHQIPKRDAKIVTDLPVFYQFFIFVKLNSKIRLI